MPEGWFRIKMVGGALSSDFKVNLDGTTRVCRPLLPMEDLQEWGDLRGWRGHFLDWLVDEHIEHAWTIEEFVDIEHGYRHSYFIVEIRREADLIMARLRFNEIEIVSTLVEMIAEIIRMRTRIGA